MFFTFEGIDGSGKTTIINKVVTMLKKNGYNVVLTHEPGGTVIGEKIRYIILHYHNIDRKTEALLYAADRRQNVIENIIPNIKKKIVICDRYFDSSLAYQGIVQKIGLKKTLDINLFAIENILPNVTFLLDIDPKISLLRIKDNNRETNRIDLKKETFHLKVRKAFLQLAKRYKNRFIVINANQNSEKIANEIYQKIKKICHISKII